MCDFSSKKIADAPMIYIHDTYKGVRYQNRVKRKRVHFGRNFWKIFKYNDFGLNFLEKGS